MAYKIIPLTSDPNQKLSVTLPINNINLTLNLTVRYNTVANYWVMTIADKDNDLILDSVPLITGGYSAADILGQYQYLGIGSAYIVNVGNSALDYPDDTCLGTDFVLVWGDNYE